MPIRIVWTNIAAAKAVDREFNDTCAWTPNRGGPTERAPKEEIQSSENPKIRMFDNIAEKRIF